VFAYLTKSAYVELKSRRALAPEGRADKADEIAVRVALEMRYKAAAEEIHRVYAELDALQATVAAAQAWRDAGEEELAVGPYVLWP